RRGEERRPVPPHPRCSTASLSPDSGGPPGGGVRQASAGPRHGAGGAVPRRGSGTMSRGTVRRGKRMGAGRTEQSPERGGEVGGGPDGPVRPAARGEGPVTVLFALGANIGVGLLKLAAGLITGSTAMLSEAAH